VSISTLNLQQRQCASLAFDIRNQEPFKENWGRLPDWRNELMWIY